MSNTDSLLQDYEGMRIILLKNISHSSLLTSHQCPRKFQLDKFRQEEDEEAEPGNIHFAFGHAVGAGIQRAFYPHATIEDCYLATFLAWDVDLFEAAEKKGKSFWHAIRAVDSAFHLAKSIQGDGWELAWFDLQSRDGTDGGPVVCAEPRPAIEYSFRVEFPNGYKYRGHIDLILYNKEKHKYRVVEIKTTGSTWINEAMYANSAQALSYDIVLDWLVKDAAGYEVLYMVYLAKIMEWQCLPFPKSRHAKAEWIRNVLHDCRTIESAIKDNYFPKHGESCFDFYSQCKYFGRCGFSDEFLGLSDPKRISEGIAREEKKVYQVDIRLQDLLKHQLLELEGELNDNTV